MKMKLLGTYTARGVVSESETAAGNPQRIYLHQGTNKIGYRVVDFKIWGTTWSGSSEPDVIGKLSKNDIGVAGSAASFFRADDDNQIAWATSAGQTDSGGSPFAESIIDPENLCVQDLYVYARGASSTTTQPINYLITMEKYEIDGWRGTLEMARDEFDGQ